jgi:GNAT superfamily N-acetyltransferase
VIEIRAAQRADAAAMSAVLISSITDLCAADHGNDPEALASWLANKSVEGVGRWFDNPANRLFVACVDGTIAAVGGINDTRSIILNYVAPAYRFMGVSKAMLHALETALGPGEARLDATKTARPFYVAAGWEESGPARSYRYVPGYPMRKQLR